MYNETFHQFHENYAEFYVKVGFNIVMDKFINKKIIFILI
jgi:hypothetical protein